MWWGMAESIFSKQSFEGGELLSANHGSEKILLHIYK